MNDNTPKQDEGQMPHVMNECEHSCACMHAESAGKAQRATCATSAHVKTWRHAMLNFISRISPKSKSKSFGLAALQIKQK